MSIENAPKSKSVQPEAKQNKDRYKQLEVGYIFSGKSGKKYKIAKRIGEGGMGAVYEVEDTDTRKRYAVKTEKLRPLGQRLAMEKFIMEVCVSDHIPQFKDRGKTENFVWIAMELVGESLRGKFKNAGMKFSVGTCLKIAIQMLQGMRVLHSKGFVHRDLKPENLAVGLRGKSQTIVILDTGIARQYKDVDGVPHRPRPDVKFKGTRVYASAALQRNLENGAKDDLESWLYIIAQFSAGKLPWSHLTDADEILKMKDKCRDSPEVICKGSDITPLWFVLWKYLNRMKYEEDIDYEYMLHLLNGTHERLSKDEIFDWDKN